ncbi:protein draper-like [Ptychodera flava]|uniref:protein draper-like n=1 Tax=Ptychodera flava TaxID=63121 RepID=UPI00396A334A
MYLSKTICMETYVCLATVRTLNSVTGFLEGVPVDRVTTVNIVTKIVLASTGAYCGNDQFDNCICSSGWAGSECSDCDTGIVKAVAVYFVRTSVCIVYNGHRCSVENGDCECSPGWQGNRCDQICDEGYYGNNCSEVCRCKGNKCNHITGICQCESEESGEQCEDPCPGNCLVCEDNVCTSCKSGWTGEHCSNRCKPGFYGESCKETCTECNCSTSCHYVNGSCQEVVRGEEHECKYRNARICMENPFNLECQDGWTGRLCDLKTSTKTAKEVSKTVKLKESKGMVIDKLEIFLIMKIFQGLDRLPSTVKSINICVTSHIHSTRNLIQQVWE